MTEPLTDAQLEAAARKLCELRLVDPDWVHGFNGHNHEVYGKANWQIVADEIHNADQIKLALEHGQSQPKQTPPQPD